MADTIAVPAQRRGLKAPRHELPSLRASDIAPFLNISLTSAWRLRQLPGFPARNALGRYSAAEVSKFIERLDPEALRAARRQARTDRHADLERWHVRWAGEVRGEKREMHLGPYLTIEEAKRGADMLRGQGLDPIIEQVTQGGGT